MMRMSADVIESRLFTETDSLDGRQDGAARLQAAYARDFSGLGTARHSRESLRSGCSSCGYDSVRIA